MQAAERVSEHGHPQPPAAALGGRETPPVSPPSPPVSPAPPEPESSEEQPAGDEGQLDSES